MFQVDFENIYDLDIHILLDQQVAHKNAVHPGMKYFHK